MAPQLYYHCQIIMRHVNDVMSLVCTIQYSVYGRHNKLLGSKTLVLETTCMNDVNNLVVHHN